MRPPNDAKRWVFLTATFAILILCLLRFQWVSRQYPYYFIWDMDLTVVEDCLLINSGFFPDHIALPGFGAHLLLAHSIEAARVADFVSVANLEDLAGSLNPLACMAELTDWARGHSPFISLGIMLFLWVTVLVLLEPPPLLRVLSLAVFGLQPSLLYHASMIRMAHYAMLFWAGAALLVVLAARNQSHRTQHAVLLLGAGLGAGLAFFTKIQSVFYIVALPGLYWAGAWLADPGPSPRIPPAAPQRTSTALGFLAVVAAVTFPLLLWAACRTPIPGGISKSNSAFGLNPLGIGASMTFTGLALSQIVLLRTKKTNTPAGLLLTACTLLAMGFLLTLPLHFIFYASPAQSLTYMLRDLKMAFARTMGDPREGYSMGPGQVARDYLRFMPWAFFFHAAAFAGVIRRLTQRRQAATRIVMTLSALSGLAGAAAVFGARFILRDLIWAEILLNTLTTIYILLVVRLSQSRGREMKAGAAALLVVLCIVSGLQQLDMPARIDANYNLYGWQDEQWLHPVYAANQIRYGEVMRNHFTGEVGPAKQQAEQHAGVRRTVSFVFPNQHINHRHIGVVAQGAPVWVHDLDWRITVYPKELKGAILIDNGDLSVQRRPLYVPGEVRAPSEFLDKRRRQPASGMLGVLGRSDLRILLFADLRDACRLNPGQFMERPEQITVGKGENRQLIRAWEVWHYAEVPVALFERPFFFVIQRREPKVYHPYDLNLRQWVEPQPKTPGHGADL